MTAEPKFDYADRLASDTKLLVQMISDVDHAVDVECWEDLDQGLICFAMLEEARKNLSLITSLLEKKLAKVMPRDYTLEGVGTFEKRKRTNRTSWDREELVRDVLDSRIFDPITGEDKFPTPLDKVRHVWNLGAPRTTALRELGLDPDQYCEAEDAGYSLRLITS